MTALLPAAARAEVAPAASHVAIAWDPQAINYGRARFGLPFNDPRA